MIPSRGLLRRALIETGRIVRDAFAVSAIVMVWILVDVTPVPPKCIGTNEWLCGLFWFLDPIAWGAIVGVPVAIGVSLARSYRNRQNSRSGVSA